VKATKARACQGKIPHSVRADADEHLQRLIDAGASADSLEVYRCHHDPSHWHVGHVRNRKMPA
jgi:hypothetical protein